MKDGIDRTGNDANARAYLRPQRANETDMVSEDASDITPPDAGHAPALDRVTGEVAGTGAGAGGGNPGEDFDQDKAGGSRER